VIDKLKQHFSRKENLINWIFYLIGFCVTCYGYGLKVALLLVLFAISIIVFGLTIADTFIILRHNNKKLDVQQIVGLGMSFCLIILNILFLKIEIILYVILLSFIISFVGVYYGVKINK